MKHYLVITDEVDGVCIGPLPEEEVTRARDFINRSAAGAELWATHFCEGDDELGPVTASVRPVR